MAEDWTFRDTVQEWAWDALFDKLLESVGARLGVGEMIASAVIGYAYLKHHPILLYVGVGIAIGIAFMVLAGAIQHRLSQRWKTERPKDPERQSGTDINEIANTLIAPSYTLSSIADWYAFSFLLPSEPSRIWLGAITRTEPSLSFTFMVTNASKCAVGINGVRGRVSISFSGPCQLAPRLTPGQYLQFRPGEIESREITIEQPITVATANKMVELLKHDEIIRFGFQEVQLVGTVKRDRDTIASLDGCYVDRTSRGLHGNGIAVRGPIDLSADVQIGRVESYFVALDAQGQPMSVVLSESSREPRDVEYSMMVNRDDRDIEQRIRLNDKGETKPHFDAIEPDVDLIVGVQNVSVFVLTLDRLEGSIEYAGHRLHHQPILPERPFTLEHAEYRELMLRQILSPDTASRMSREGVVTFAAGHFAIWFRYTNHIGEIKQVRKAFPDSYFTWRRSGNSN